MTHLLPRRKQNIHWVPLLLASVAVLMAVAPWRFENRTAIPVPVAASETDTAPIRRPSMRPRYRLGAFTYECNECHRSVPFPRAVGQELTKHDEIQLAHGRNTRCLNCHHSVNREVFVDQFGEEIPWDQPQLLCSKCHGPVYRDWQRGSHGRINGYWDQSRGEQIRLKCIECHDPHDPPFPPLASAPAPQTPFSRPPRGGAHSGVRNPLRPTDNMVLGEHTDKHEER